MDVQYKVDKGKFNTNSVNFHSNSDIIILYVDSYDFFGL